MKKIILLISILLLSLPFTTVAFADAEIVERPDIRIVINGELKSYSNVPIVVNGSTLLPFREILVNMGIPNDNDHIKWDPTDESITVVTDTTNVKLKINSKTAYVNNKAIELSVAPLVCNDKTYIPARFISQSLGKKVAWDGMSQTVFIRDEAEFNQIKNILDKSAEIMSNLEKFRMVRNYSYTYSVSSINNSIESISTYQIDQKNNKASGRLMYTSNTSTLSRKNENLYYYERNAYYFIDSMEDKWKQSNLTDEGSKKIYDSHYYLKSNDVLCAALKLHNGPEPSDIILKGAVSIDGLLKQTMSDDNNTLFSLIDAQTQIEIDKETYRIKSIDLDADVKLNMMSSVHPHIKITNKNDEFNGTFTVERPDSLNKILLEATQSLQEQEMDKGIELYNRGKYEEAIKHFDQVINYNNKSEMAYEWKGGALFFLGKYKESIDSFDKGIKLNPENSDLFAWKARNYNYLEEYAKSLELCDQAIKLDPGNSFAYYVKAVAYSRKQKYKDALDTVNKSIDLDKEYEIAYTLKVSILYSQKEYNQCIEFAEKAQKLFPENEDLPWYKADCFYAILKYEKAIDALKEVLEINPENDTVIASIGWNYYYLQEYSKSGDYCRQALKINDNNEDALDLQKALEYEKLPEGRKIAEFIEENYLYNNDIEGFEAKAREFSLKKEVTASEVRDFVNSIKLKDDIFTFVLTGDAYDEIVKEDDTNEIVSKLLDENTYYTKINSFTASTAFRFKNILESFSNTGSKNLVIDLRDNGGGLSITANDILDYLLPQCITSTLIYRDGYTYSKYSGEGQVKFKKIIVLVNENSASSSELLALGLKKYLNNVVIVGHITFGKGVGQITYEDKAKKYMVFLVNHFWNVKEQNIMDKGITPDVLVQGSKDSDYFGEVSKQLNANRD